MDDECSNCSKKIGHVFVSFTVGRVVEHFCNTNCLSSWVKAQDAPEYVDRVEFIRHMHKKVKAS